MHSDPQCALPTYCPITHDDHLTQCDYTDVITLAVTGPHFLEPHIASCCLTRQGDTWVRIVVSGIGRTVYVRHVVVRYRQFEVVQTDFTYDLNRFPEARWLSRMRLSKIDGKRSEHNRTKLLCLWTYACSTTWHLSHIMRPCELIQRQNAVRRARKFPRGQVIHIYLSWPLYYILHQSVIKLMDASQIYCPHCGAGVWVRIGTVLVSCTITNQQSVHSSVCCHGVPGSSMNRRCTVRYITWSFFK